MTGDMKIMNKAEKIEPIPIGLPNGSLTMASKKGSVALGNNITLNRVLYVPNLWTLRERGMLVHRTTLFLCP